MDISMDMLECMDTQDVFDYCASHMLMQGKRGCDERGKCMYRAPGGGRCAVGFLIPDSIYSPIMEHRYAGDLAAMLETTWYGHRFARFLRAHIGLLHELQAIHDGREPGAWQTELYALAQRRGLDVTVVRLLRNPVRVVLAARETTLAGTRPSQPMFYAVPLPSFMEADHGSKKHEETREVSTA